jgi:hypothetical protein
MPAPAVRNTAGELRVLSYAALKALPRELLAHAAQMAGPAEPATSSAAVVAATSSAALDAATSSAALDAATSSAARDAATSSAARDAATSSAARDAALALSGEWAAVATRELLAIATSQFRGMSVRAVSPAETSEWATVATSELRAIGTSEFHALATSGPVNSALRAVTTRESRLRSSLPSMIVSEPTALELVSQRGDGAAGAAAYDDEPARPTKPDLPVYRRQQVSSRAPLSAPSLVLCGLLVAAAIALGTAVTLRLLRAAEAQRGRAPAYARAPMPPDRVPVTPAILVAPPPEAALPAEPMPVTAVEPAPLPPRRTRAQRPRAREHSGETSAASRASRVRIDAAWAPIRVGNDAASPVVCSLPRGTVLSVLAELPEAHARWFAVRCNGQAVGWVQESYLAPLGQ